MMRVIVRIKRDKVVRNVVICAQLLAYYRVSVVDAVAVNSDCSFI